MKMNIALIIIGAILIAVGVIRIVSEHKEPAEKAIDTNPKVVVIEKHYHNTVEVEAAPQQAVPQQTAPQPTAQQPTTTPSTAQQTHNVDVEDVSKAKGNEFEDFVVNLLADWRFKLLDRTQDAVSTAGVVAESCKNPDLHVQQKRGKGSVDYYLECKYRSHWDNGAVEFENWQIDRYRQFQRDEHRKVLFALGVGGSPSNPKSFMVVPLDSVMDNSIKQIKTQFAIEPTSSNLAEYMYQYFGTVFDKAKSKKNENS